MNLAEVVGGLVSVFATGVLFGETLAVNFADLFGTTVFEAAAGWLIFGMSIAAVGVLSDAF